MSSDYYIRVFLLTGCFFICINFSYAQKNKSQNITREILQFSGRIVDSQTNIPVPNAHVYIKKSGRGVNSNYHGFFTLPVEGGDSIVASSVGFEPRLYVIPESYNDNITFVVHMEYDTVYLKEVTVRPFLSEREFKKQVLEMDLNDTWDNKVVMGNSNPAMVRQVAQHIQFKQRDYSHMKQGTGRMTPTSNFLNPFAWYRFLRKKTKKQN